MATLKNTLISGSLQLPSGTTAQRPSYPPDGAVRYNTDLGYAECYHKGFWFDVTNGLGMPIQNDLVFAYDAGVPASYPGSGNDVFSLANVANRDALLYNGASWVSDGLNSYFRTSENQSITVENVCESQFMTVEVVFRRFNNNPEDILFNKENCWEMKTDSDTLQWAVQTNNQGWFWQNTGSIVTNQWYYVALTYDGDFVRTYLNGRLRETYTYPANGVLTTPIAYPKFNARGAGRFDLSNTGFHDCRYWAFYDNVLIDRQIQHNWEAYVKRWTDIATNNASGVGY